MKIKATGEILPNVTAIGNELYPSYIVLGSEKCFMIEAGINLLAPLYAKSFNDACNKAHPDYLFMTHSHYDHIGSFPYLKKKFPSIITAGHKKIEDLLKKPSVLMRMGYLSDMQRAQYSDITGNEDVRLEKTEIDQELKEGDSFNLGNSILEVYSAPGHTRDSLAFFLPEEKILFPGDSIGLPMGPDGTQIKVEFLSSYYDYLKTIIKLQALRPRIIAFSHNWVLTGDDVQKFFDDTYNEAVDYQKTIEDYIERLSGDINYIVKVIAEKEYDQGGTISQERSAYIINLTAQVRHIARLLDDDNDVY